MIIRFSSIGDIVLTTPVVRCLKTQLNAEIHYLTKKSFKPILSNNPYIDKLWTIDNTINEVADGLTTENFHQIVDLHKNFRSYGIRMKLKVRCTSFPKINLKKWLLVNLNINLMPDIHIVDRYFKAVKSLGIANDGKGLDYFLPMEEKPNPENTDDLLKQSFIALVIGGKHNTKVFPMEKLIAVISQTTQNYVLLGGPEDRENGEIIKGKFPDRVYNACGELSINQSAWVVKQAEKLITNDTGLMHIATALEKDILSIWGNTVPELGMYPYLPEKSKAHSEIAEVKGLNCRPCSKIGYDQCPKKHFRCMKLINELQIIRFINR